MNVDAIRELVTSWRDEAQLFRRRGMEERATMAESYASDLEERLKSWWQEPLTLRQAAEESGYSYDHLQHLVSDGGLPNSGRDGAPRVRRCDLPRKPSPSSLKSVEGDLADQALAAELQGGR